jgi:hypothetical protein
MGPTQLQLNPFGGKSLGHIGFLDCILFNVFSLTLEKGASAPIKMRKQTGSAGSTAHMLAEFFRRLIEKKFNKFWVLIKMCNYI